MADPRYAPVPGSPTPTGGFPHGHRALNPPSSPGSQQLRFPTSSPNSSSESLNFPSSAPGSRTQSFASTVSASAPYAAAMRGSKLGPGQFTRPQPPLLLSSQPSSRHTSLAATISDKYQFDPDPASWGLNPRTAEPEPDDALHDPRGGDRHSHNIFTARGSRISESLTSRSVGYPLTKFLTEPRKPSNLSVNATGQVASIGNFGLIDLDTPKEFYKIHGYHDPSETLQLVFSDEFEQDARSFYPGDDPYWEAVDLHYWATGNMEWYDPSADITTNHDLQYKGGMMSTWNKFCFTGGLILANVMLPGTTNVFGLWPALWTIFRACLLNALLDTIPDFIQRRRTVDITFHCRQTFLRSLAGLAMTEVDCEQENSTINYVAGTRSSQYYALIGAEISSKSTIFERCPNAHNMLYGKFIAEAF
ncbi:beta-glucan synthesis-associated protein-domain-containing protein [Mycena amicta]|nr:beta-glucan synthesis-associated protein-domain-containing protein [Mycena amicta]KAJ7059430.1 beta-glucan synthesis-associated protein-domain-containing protein [Mycena amicta]